MDGSRETWGEYQRLVLAELERHDKLLQDLFAKIQKQDIDLDRLKDVTGNIRSVTLRVDKLEASDLAAVAVKKYKSWILSGFVLLAGSIVIPLIKIIFFGGAG